MPGIYPNSPAVDELFRRYPWRPYSTTPEPQYETLRIVVSSFPVEIKEVVVQVQRNTESHVITWLYSMMMERDMNLRKENGPLTTRHRGIRFSAFQPPRPNVRWEYVEE